MTYQGFPERTQGALLVYDQQEYLYRRSCVLSPLPRICYVLRGQPFEGINFYEWKANANVLHLSVHRILTAIPSTVTPHTCMVSTGWSFLFYFFLHFSPLFMLALIALPSKFVIRTMVYDPKTFNILFPQ